MARLSGHLPVRSASRSRTSPTLPQGISLEAPPSSRLQRSTSRPRRGVGARPRPYAPLRGRATPNPISDGRGRMRLPPFTSTSRSRRALAALSRPGLGARPRASAAPARGRATPDPISDGRGRAPARATPDSNSDGRGRMISRLFTSRRSAGRTPGSTCRASWRGFATRCAAPR